MLQSWRMPGPRWHGEAPGRGRGEGEAWRGHGVTMELGGEGALVAASLLDVATVACPRSNGVVAAAGARRGASVRHGDRAVAEGALVAAGKGGEGAGGAVGKGVRGCGFYGVAS